MLKSIQKSLLLVSIVAGCLACNEKEFVEYKPHYLNHNSDQKYYGEAELDSVEFASFQQVLNVYGEEYKTKNGNVILITSELANNWDLLWNYTSKANDSEWLRTHSLD
jgi:hypothetical protein